MLVPIDIFVMEFVNWTRSQHYATGAIVTAWWHVFSNEPRLPVRSSTAVWWMRFNNANRFTQLQSVYGLLAVQHYKNITRLASLLIVYHKPMKTTYLK